MHSPRCTLLSLAQHMWFQSSTEVFLCNCFFQFSDFFRLCWQSIRFYGCEIEPNESGAYALRLWLHCSNMNLSESMSSELANWLLLLSISEFMVNWRRRRRRRRWMNGPSNKLIESVHANQKSLHQFREPMKWCRLLSWFCTLHPNTISKQHGDNVDEDVPKSRWLVETQDATCNLPQTSAIWYLSI